MKSRENLMPSGDDLHHADGLGQWAHEVIVREAILLQEILDKCGEFAFSQNPRIPIMDEMDFRLQLPSITSVVIQRGL